MSRKFYLSFLAIALALTAAVAFVVGHNSRTNASPASSALAALPASDFVVSVDVQRALNETLPGLLANNPSLLAKFNSHLEEFQQKTGINPRVFETVAIGGKLSHIAGRHDDDAVVIARGQFDSTDLINTGFAAAQKECEFEKEEQQYEGHTIYLVSAVRSLKKETGDASSPAPRGPYAARLSATRPGREKFAITALDANTIAVGSPDRVRAAIDASLERNRVDEELVRLASQRPEAVVGFSGKIPQSVAERSAPDNNPMAKYFASIRGFYGSLGVTGEEAEAFVALRTESAAQAGEIGQAISTLKGFATLGISRSAGKDTAALADLLKGLSITTADNEVRIDFKAPQSSLGSLMRLR